MPSEIYAQSEDFPSLEAQLTKFFAESPVSLAIATGEINFKTCIPAPRVLSEMHSTVGSLYF